MNFWCFLLRKLAISPELPIFYTSRLYAVTTRHVYSITTTASRKDHTRTTVVKTELATEKWAITLTKKIGQWSESSVLDSVSLSVSIRITNSSLRGVNEKPVLVEPTSVLFCPVTSPSSYSCLFPLNEFSYCFRILGFAGLHAERKCNFLNI